MELSSSIKTQRIRRGLSQAELGEAIGVTRSTISLWERGICAPKYNNLDALALALMCTIDELRQTPKTGRQRKGRKQ